MTWKLILILLLVLTGIIAFSAFSGTKKILLFENSIYHWKVYFVKKSHLSVGTYRHFEVYYKERKLVLPKEITDGHLEISEFVGATAVDNRSSQFGSVIVTFEGSFVREDGVPYRAFITLLIRPGKGEELIVTNPCDGRELIIY